MKIMSNHSSARPHTIKSTNNGTISEVLKQRAQSVINDKSVDDMDMPPTREKIEALAEIICSGGNEAPAALLVLMAILENASEPQTLAHTIKHFAFTRCGELNLFGMVDAQTAFVETELLAAGSFAV
jgi:hypothetical protein